MAKRHELAAAVGSLRRNSGLKGIGKACVEALEGRVLLTTILSEGFEGSFPSDNGWSVGDSNSSDTTAYWGQVDSAFGGEGTHMGSGKGYCAGVGYAGTAAAPSYQSSMMAYMSRTIDLTGLSSATLSFWYKTPSIESYYDYLRVYVGSNELLSVDTAVTSWTQAAYDLTSYVGTSPTLRFEFSSDEVYTLEGAYLDDISVTGSGPAGQIEGDKWNDLDGDGARDAGEPGLAGWTVYLDSDNDGALDAGEPTQVTDASGHYAFTDLAAGTYRVREVLQSGWTQTYPGNTANRLFEVRVEGSASTIDELDPTTGAAINSFGAPAAIGFNGPQGLALGSNSLFYIDSSVSPLTLWELNSDTGAVIDSDIVAPVSPMFAAGLGYLNGKVYIEKSDSNQILVWDPVSDTAVTTLNVAADLSDGLTGAGDRGVLYDSDQSGQIFKIDPATGAVLATFSPGVGPVNGGLAYVNGELIAAGWETSGLVYRINPDTGVVLGTLTLGGTGSISALGGDGARAGTGVSGNGSHTVVLAASQLVTGRDFAGQQSTAPTVTAVYVRGSSWTSGYLSFLAANMSGSSATYGYAIPVGSGAAQLQTLPWRNLNRISLRFSEDVSIAQAQFAIVGSVGSYSVSGFSYSSIDRVATWSLSAAIGPDKLYVALPGSGSSAVKDVAGTSLDGEWTNPTSYGQVGSTDTFPSGNGSAGGDFAFRFDVLPGDSSGGSLGKVNVADVAQTKSRSSLPVSTVTYRSDFDGNNLVNVADVAYVKSKSSVYSLPVNPPVLPVFSSVFSQVSLLQSNRSPYLW